MIHEEAKIGLMLHVALKIEPENAKTAKGMSGKANAWFELLARRFFIGKCSSESVLRSEQSWCRMSGDRHNISSEKSLSSVIGLFAYPEGR